MLSSGSCEASKLRFLGVISFRRQREIRRAVAPEIVKLLCDAGASLESLSYRKNTPLCVAAWASTGTRLKFRDIAVPSSRQVEVARILISNGANIEAANYRLNRPLHIIAGNCDMDGSIAELLLEAGAETRHCIVQLVVEI